MSLCEDLYREVILDHYSNPRHKGPLERCTHRHEGLNPVCGDEVLLELSIDGDRVCGVGFTGQGCSISMASASMLSERLSGMSTSEVRDLADRFKGWMTHRDRETPDDFGDLEALDGVRRYPVRIKCALLAWTTLLQALDNPDHKETV